MKIRKNGVFWPSKKSFNINSQLPSVSGFYMFTSISVSTGFES